MFRQALTCLGIVLLSGGTAVWCYRSPCPTCHQGQSPPQYIRDAAFANDDTPEDRLRTAVICDDVETVKQLLAASPRPDLHTAWGPKRLSIAHYAAAGHGSVLPRLIAAGADANARSKTGETPLMYVCGSPADQACAVRALLDAGAALEAVDRAGHTPLIHAAWKGDTDLARLLLEAGADPAARDSDGHCAADFASEFPSLEPLVRQ
jgi:ankyrin repeat protein